MAENKNLKEETNNTQEEFVEPECVKITDANEAQTTEVAVVQKKVDWKQIGKYALAVGFVAGIGASVFAGNAFSDHASDVVDKVVDSTAKVTEF